MNVLRKRQFFLHLDQIDTTSFQHGPAGKIDLVHDQLIIQARAHRGAGARQEAGAQPVGGFPKPQIQAGRLDLIVQKRRIGGDPALADGALEFAIRENAVCGQSRADP